MKKANKKGKNKKLSLVSLLLVVSAFLFWFFKILKPSKRNKFEKNVESWFRRILHSVHLHFIPHEHNDYKPRVFQKHAVRHLLLIIILVKVTVVSLLIMVYPNQGFFNKDVQGNMYRLINEYRAEQGLVPLSSNLYLEQAAAAKAADMTTKNYFSHFGPDGTKPWQWFDPSQYTFTVMGENLAMDFLTAGAVVHAFQQSPLHDANLLNKKYEEIGIGITNGYIDGNNTNVMVVFFAAADQSAATTLAKATLDIVEEPISNGQDTEITLAEDITPNDDAEDTTQTEIDTIDTTKLRDDTTPVENNETPEQGTLPLATNTHETKKELKVVVRALDAPDDIEAEVLGQSTGALPVYQGPLIGGQTYQQGDWLQRMISWSDRFFMLILIIVSALLVINIVVKVKIQHRSVIANAVMLLIVAGAALYINVHSAEAVQSTVRVLAAHIF